MKEEFDEGECAECGKSWYFCTCSAVECWRCGEEWGNCKCFSEEPPPHKDDF
jgi:hypothetical protein